MDFLKKKKVNTLPELITSTYMHGSRTRKTNYKIVHLGPFPAKDWDVTKSFVYRGVADQSN